MRGPKSTYFSYNRKKWPKVLTKENQPPILDISLKNNTEFFFKSENTVPNLEIEKCLEKSSYF